MQHLILTKLATGCPGDDWLIARLPIFVEFCAASIAAQNNKQFKWLLAVNPKIPAWFIDGIEKVLPSANAILVYTDGTEKLFPRWTPLIEAHVAHGRLLTTRLDNDDMLHRDFVETVQKAAENSDDDTVLDFPSGYQLRQSDLNCRRCVSSRPTHFISLVETGRRTAFGCGNHSRVNTKFNVRNIHHHPMWVEVCHTHNLGTRFRETGAIADWQEVKRQFTEG
jgi:hypothetical protein